MSDDSPAAGTFRSHLKWPAFLLGFSLGGFFDGILLHQILQWHHLLSGIDRAPFSDLRVQLAMDGVFHLLMYVVAIVGGILLWKARAALRAPGAGTLMVAAGLLGFGGWHVADTILSHWVLGIHRIRQDSDIPLLWDLAWLAAFGLLPLLASRLLWPRGPREGDSRGGLAASSLGLVVLLAAPVAALPPREADATLVLFRSGTSEAEAMAAAASVGARLVWSDGSGSLMALRFDDAGAATALYGRGALWVSSSLLPATCLDWLRP